MTPQAAAAGPTRRALQALAASLLVAHGCGDAREANAELPDADVADAERPAAPRCGLDLRLWALENEALVAPVACATGLALPSEAFSLKHLPPGAALDSNTGELRWTPALDQAGSYTIEVGLPGRERGEIRIGVADRFEDPDNEPIRDPLRYAHEFAVPVFHLGAPDVNGDAHTPATLIYEGRELHGVSAKYRGSTSANYPKRSFTIKFDKDAPFVDEPRGFHGARRIVFTTTFDDNSALRQRLAFELWNRLDPEHIQIRHFNAVVYLNGHYQGLYEVSDHVDEDLLRAAGFPRDLNMYKGRRHSANFRMTDEKGKPKRQLRAGYSKEAGLPEDGSEGAYADLEALVDWIANASDDAFFAEWETRLARRDFEDWLVFTSLIGAGDTTNKNCYLIHDPRPDAPDSRWRFVPWDFNVSFGQGYLTQRLAAERFDVDSYYKKNALFERLLRDPRLREPMLERYRVAMREPWPVEEIVATLETWAAEIERAALRDEVKWGEAFRSYWSGRSDWTSHPEEIAYLRDWIRARWSFYADHL